LLDISHKTELYVVNHNTLTVHLQMNMGEQ